MSNNNIPQIKVTIESIDAEGKGIARVDGKTVFIPDVLPDEEVLIEIYKTKPKFDLARIVEIIEPSKDRIEPECPNFKICGGCSIQHIEFNAQVRNKEKVLLDNLKHIGRVDVANILPPILGKSWGYRHRARLSARYVEKKGGALVGFHEKASSYVADIHECLILPKHISDLIPELRALLTKLSIKDRIPQIEVAIGDQISVLVLRVMENLSLADENYIKEFIDKSSTTEHPIQIWLQPKGPDSCYPFYPISAPMLSYTLPKSQIEIQFYPTEFTQVNPELNQQMVDQAIRLLNLNENDIVCDFFCGIGNFTLAIAKLAKHVKGIEGSEALTRRALENALHNNLADKTDFSPMNLFQINAESLASLGKFDKWLIDPPRDGAKELVAAITPEIAPSLIVYVSCNPATLARDANTLVHEHRYKLIHAGVMNMFPHTSHVESIAVFINQQ